MLTRGVYNKRIGPFLVRIQDNSIGERGSWQGHAQTVFLGKQAMAFTVFFNRLSRLSLPLHSVLKPT